MPSMWSIFLICAERKIGNPWKATMINMNQLNHVVTPTYAVLNHVHAFIHINHHSQELASTRSPSTCHCLDVKTCTCVQQAISRPCMHMLSIVALVVCAHYCTVINYHLLTSDDALALPLYPCLTRRQDSRCKINAVFSRCKPNASIPC